MKILLSLILALCCQVLVAAQCPSLSAIRAQANFDHAKSLTAGIYRGVKIAVTSTPKQYNTTDGNLWYVFVGPLGELDPKGGHELITQLSYGDSISTSSFNEANNRHYERCQYSSYLWVRAEAYSCGSSPCPASKL